MTESELKDTAPEHANDTVSKRLTEAREAKGLSQKEVADELFLTTTFIRYIDDGDFHKIPKPAFIKGYLRSYARVVGIDANDLVSAYEVEQNVPPQTPKIIDVTESAEPSSGLSGPLVQTGLAGLGVLLLVAIVVWWVASDDEPPPVVSSIPEDTIEDTAENPMGDPAGNVADDTFVEPATDEPRPAAVVIPETPALELQETVESSSQQEQEAVELAESAIELPVETNPEPEPVVEEAIDPASALDAEDAVVEEGPDVQIERASEGDTNYISVYAGGEAEVGFEFTDECWVEIRDGDGFQIYADLNRAGDIMTVYGKRPFDILLGRAPAVAMTFDGEEVNLARFTTRDETARVRTARL